LSKSSLFSKKLSRIDPTFGNLSQYIPSCTNLSWYLLF